MWVYSVERVLFVTCLLVRLSSRERLDLTWSVQATLLLLSLVQSTSGKWVSPSIDLFSSIILIVFLMLDVKVKYIISVCFQEELC